VARDWVVRTERTNHPCTVEAVDDGFDVVFGGKRFEVRSSWEIGQPLWNGMVNYRPLSIQLDRLGTVPPPITWTPDKGWGVVGLGCGLLT
jgi:propionyl-CoA carboxylase alpha chain